MINIHVSANWAAMLLSLELIASKLIAHFVSSTRDKLWYRKPSLYFPCYEALHIIMLDVSLKQSRYTT